MREFDLDYDKGKLSMSKEIHSLNLRIKTLLLENDTLKDILERKQHLLRSPSQYRSRFCLVFLTIRQLHASRQPR